MPQVSTAQRMARCDCPPSPPGRGGHLRRVRQQQLRADAARHRVAGHAREDDGVPESHVPAVERRGHGGAHGHDTEAAAAADCDAAAENESNVME